ncbi:MAG: O-antigen ligase family protein [Chloroflexi bacterium]|nr:O-antigen ligase family protein [Chloroflexota bacterium]
MRSRTDLLTFGLLLALMLTLPFEPIRPLVSLGFFDLNQLKFLEAALIGVWLIGLASRREPPRLPRDTWLAAGLFLGIALLSALLATAYRGEALKFVGRLASGVFAFLVVRELVQGRLDRIRAVLWAITLGAGVSAVLGLGEMAGWPVLDPVLRLFKLAPTRVGPDLRLSASFQYATIAAVFFELAAPLAIVLAATEAGRWRRALAMAIAAACSVAVVLTLTRAGIIALVAAFGLLLTLAVTRRRWHALALPTGLACASGFAALALLSMHMRNFDPRLATENDWGWYAATYDVPATLTLTPNTATNAVITARNTGEVVWTAGGANSFALGYRWLSGDAASQLEVPTTVLDLPHDVAPGEAVQLTVDVDTRLPPGDYRLAWGMLQQQVLWFHDRGYPDAETQVHVMGGTTSPAASRVGLEPRSDLYVPLPPMPRTELWSAALGIIRQHPLLGAGPDNFRHIYGAYLGLTAWDDRVSANNLYLELLADVGVLGALAFGLLVGMPVVSMLRGLRSPGSPTQALLLAGFAASVLAYFVHGGLDSFLEFTPVYLLFWVVLGLSMAAAELGRSDAMLSGSTSWVLSEGRGDPYNPHGVAGPVRHDAHGDGRGVPQGVAADDAEHHAR